MKPVPITLKKSVMPSSPAADGANLLKVVGRRVPPDIRPADWSRSSVVTATIEPATTARKTMIRAHPVRPRSMVANWRASTRGGMRAT
jgi:hypothetical protein